MSGDGAAGVSARAGGGGRRIRPCSLGGRDLCGGGSRRMGMGTAALLYVWVAAMCVCVYVGRWVNGYQATPSRSRQLPAYKHGGGHD